MSARVVLVFTAALLAAGCVGSSTTKCSDGRVCPASTVCVSSLGRCARAEELAACTAHGEDEACSYSDLPVGTCTSGVCVSSTCGDGAVISPEICDDGNQRSGDGCAADCLSDETCGNGVVDLRSGEACDDGSAPDTPTDACRPDCSLRTCGDGILDDGEVCDDGNNVSSDGCDARCASKETCGNNVFDPQKAETCDDGNTDDGDGCNSTCKIEACGNGVIDGQGTPLGEVCDDGDTDPGDGCSANCRSDETCGNGVVDPINNETCDDGATIAGDGCDAGCHTEVCGNGVIDANEVCDPMPGNTVSGDGCSADCLSNESCGNGYIDIAIGEECDPPVSDPTQCRGCKVPRCGDGVIDANRNEQCDDGGTNSDLPDAACRTNCLSARCGDGITDLLANEVCDDGNFVSGDGCAPDCASDERCGNLITDYAIGERCDDGNLESHDGCASSCQIEAATWTAHLFASPYNSSVAGNWLAYDAGRGHTVLFVGTSIWERDSGSWVAETPSRQPAGFNGTAIVYDASRQHTLAFGGSGGVFTNETWAWDGRDWTQLFPATSPPPRAYHALAFDTARARAVLFGGTNNATTFGDTWEWDGATWTQRSPATSPPARSNGAFAYDPVRNRTVLFGGGSLADTWEWDGTTWTQAQPATSPSARNNAALAFDASRGTLILFGGRAGTTNLDDTWEWNGTTWAQLSPVAKPSPAPALPGMAYDLARQRLVLSSQSGTWEFDGTTWATAIVSPPDNTNNHPGLAYDVLRAHTVYEGAALFGEGAATYEWTGLSWTRVLSVTTHPSMCGGNVTPLAFDAERGRVVSYGIGKTWTYDGTDWTSVDVAPSAALACLKNYALAYDAARKRVVLFGGLLTVNNYQNTTWEWDGTSWQDKTPAFSPSGREQSAMAYDPVRGKVVLFGGLNGTISDPVRLADTWEWDGATWTPMMPSSAPTARSGHGMAYDPGRKTIVVYGGNRGSNSSLTDTWEWDGTSWTNLATTQQTLSTSIKLVTPLAYAAPFHQLITVQTVAGSGGGNGAWSLRSDSASPSETCVLGFDSDHDGLLGCADPDCAAYCDPLCSTLALCSDPLRPHCGDDICGATENGRLCPADCTITPICGDYICDAMETTASCPGDCL